MTPWLTTAEAAAYAKCSKTTILRAIKSGRLQAARLDGVASELRTRTDWIDHWLLTPSVALPADDALLRAAAIGELDRAARREWQRRMEAEYEINQAARRRADSSIVFPSAMVH